MSGVSDQESVQMGPGRRWTGNTEILVIEARMQADGGTLENPAWPLNPATKRRAEQRLQSEGIDIVPVWSDLEEYPNLTPDGVVHDVIGGDGGE